MGYDVQNLDTGESQTAADLDTIRAALERLMQREQRWQVISHPQPGSIFIEASGIWPDMSSLEEFEE